MCITNRFALRMGLSLTLLIGVAGCGGAPATQADIGGTITLDGKPLGKGSVSFIPADGRGPASGGTITDGRFATKLLAGAKRIEVRSPKVIGRRQVYEGAPDSPVIDIVEELLPSRYNTNSELNYDVRPGENRMDIELVSSK